MTNSVIISEDYTLCEFLDIYRSAADFGVGIKVSDGAGNGRYSRIENCIARVGKSGSSTNAFNISTQDYPVYVYKCLAYDSDTGFRGPVYPSGQEWFNCVAASCGSGFKTGTTGSGITAKNCVAYSNTTNYSDTFSASSTNNATSTGSDDAPGANSVYGVTSAAFVNAASNDFHLASGSALIGAGTNLYSTFTTDIDGDTWPSSGAWDIGFDYRVAGGGGATLTADSGAYTLTGTAATLKADRKLAAGSGSYAITGTDVSLKLGRKLTAESGTYTVNGTTVSLTVGRKLVADSGTYSLTGTDVTLTYQPAGGYTLALDSGSYTLTGTAATLKASRKLTADSGTYALTGTDVTLTRGFKITADSGTYTLTGSNVSFARTYRLPADSGSYTLSGSPVSLSWSGEVIPETPTNGGPSIYGKAVFREKEFKREYEREVSRIENERIRAIQMREDEEIVIIMAALAA
jgi:hypothetical protein